MIPCHTEGTSPDFGTEVYRAVVGCVCMYVGGGEERSGKVRMDYI